MKLHQLRSLITVAEKGSIHEASRSLHVTQPAISKALQDLESELGAPLLVRSANGVRLTSYGLALTRRARVVEQELRHAREEIDALLGSANGTLTVGVTPVTAVVPLGEALKTFVADYPHVNVNVLELRPGEIQNRVLDGTLDFGLVSRVGEPEDTRFHWETLYTTATSLAVRRDHALRGPCSLRTLSTQSWLLWDAFDDGTSLLAAIFGAHRLAPPERVLRCTSTALYRALSTETDVVSLWAETVFDHPARALQMRPLELLEPLPHFSIGLVCWKLELVTPIAAQLIGRVRETVARRLADAAAGDAQHTAVPVEHSAV